MRLTLATVWVMAQRKLLKHDHVTVKGKLQDFWQDAVVRDPQAGVLLVAELERLVRPNLRDILDSVARQQVCAVLATAAAAEYAMLLGEKLGFQHILATPPLRDNHQQNVGSVKRDRTLAFLATQGWSERPRIFFTDHEEDLPLIQVSDKIIWLGSDSSRALVQREVQDKIIIAARDMDTKALLSHLSV